MKLPYLKQNCNLTLKEGLEVHYGANESFKANVILVPAFYNHDIAHVLFGLSTNVKHEALVDTRVIFGTNWGIKKYMNDYLKNPDAQKIIMKIFKDIGYIKGILISLTALPKVMRVIVDCKKMSKVWMINPTDKVLNTNLSELRKEYNIKVIN
tara:strand:- start:2181 stop:2639 length:459 start_codon:yes stop_codon:yes gene_type:complete